MSHEARSEKWYSDIGIRSLDACNVFMPYVDLVQVRVFCRM